MGLFIDEATYQSRIVQCVQCSPKECFLALNPCEIVSAKAHHLREGEITDRLQTLNLKLYSSNQYFCCKALINADSIPSFVLQCLSIYCYSYISRLYP